MMELYIGIAQRRYGNVYICIVHSINNYSYPQLNEPDLLLCCTSHVSCISFTMSIIFVFFSYEKKKKKISLSFFLIE